MRTPKYSRGFSVLRQRPVYDRTGSWNAANCLEAMESVIQANNGRRYREVLANSFNANSPKARTIRHSFPGLYWAN